MVGSWIIIDAAPVRLVLAVTVSFTPKQAMTTLAARLFRYFKTLWRGKASLSSVVTNYQSYRFKVEHSYHWAHWLGGLFKQFFCEIVLPNNKTSSTVGPMQLNLPRACKYYCIVTGRTSTSSNVARRLLRCEGSTCYAGAREVELS